MINGIPGPGNTRKTIPSKTNEDPILATNNHLKG
jgi:hypothetical protein